jgi:hypothetical protein
MTALSDLRECASKLPDDSDAKRFLLWAEIHIGDLQDQIFELEDDLRAANKAPMTTRERKDRQRSIFTSSERE